ncbi:hypothetical protein PYW08_015032 [Mythimna loreyi]|uniref:Uncharacterized protein n=3 Tax=Mythimna loreyi TaxID=667449 RepID=A0ACC2Q9E8_9NEOP|nr:hypothetical protein PYW08_009305 [Mythimna loreyi]KAJ8732166.1 hypothetical protein PYW08_014896 [Mythimna loreyi]KAJ8732302.1 hypothetical protein PYW08_015032 [Mythimna loreyi]
METERQKFYKHKIKRILTKDDASSVIDENDKSTVTLLGSTSYHKQVNDFSIMNSSNTDQQSETLLDDKVEPNFHAITVNEVGISIIIILRVVSRLILFDVPIETGL